MKFLQQMAQIQKSDKFIGIDLASLTKIALANGNSIEVLTNQANFRQTPFVVGYGADERKIGVSGNMKLKSNFKDTIVYPLKYLGMDQKHGFVKNQTKFAYNNMNTNESQFSVNYNGQKVLLTAQQVVGAFLGKLKSIIEHNNVQIDQKNLVIAVPDHFSQAQRQSLINSTLIGGIPGCRLINQSQCVVLEYIRGKKIQVDQRGRNVVFIDLGNTKLRSFVCNLKKDSGVLVKRVEDRNLGCRDIDIELAEFYRNIFYKKTGLDVLGNKKSFLKLMQNIQKQRYILSGNKQHDLLIECLMQENDLNFNLTRQQMQQIIKNIIHQVATNFRQLKNYLTQNRISIHSIQLIGGGTRIPFVKQLVKQIFGIQPSRTLNSSQTIAKGAAIAASSLLQYYFKDISTKNIIVSWNIAHQNRLCELSSNLYPPEQKQVLIKNNTCDQFKQLRIQTGYPLEILVQSQEFVPGYQSHIMYLVTNPTVKKPYSCTTIIKFKFNENERLQVQSAFVEQNNIQSKTNYHNFEGLSRRSRFFAPTNFEKVHLQKIPLFFSKVQYVNERTPQQLTKLEHIQHQMFLNDSKILKIYEIKNVLQSTLYNYRQKIQNQGTQYLGNEQKQQKLEYLSIVAKWLEDKGALVSLQELQLKIQQVHKIIENSLQRIEISNKSLTNENLQINANSMYN